MESIDEEIKHLVPSKTAYFLCFFLLFISGIAGGLIGYAMMEVFFPGTSGVFVAIGTLVIAAGIVYGISVIVSLGLQASVEWKAREKVVYSKKRPSELIRDND